jgi:hypothetical protein
MYNRFIFVEPSCALQSTLTDGKSKVSHASTSKKTRLYFYVSPFDRGKRNIDRNLVCEKELEYYSYVYLSLRRITVHSLFPEKVQSQKEE